GSSSTSMLISCLTAFGGFFADQSAGIDNCTTRKNENTESPKQGNARTRRIRTHSVLPCFRVVQFDLLPDPHTTRPRRQRHPKLPTFRRGRLPCGPSQPVAALRLHRDLLR